jgi:hypothetical protein
MKETKELLKLAISVFNSIGSVMQDGKVEYAEVISELVRIAPSVPAAIDGSGLILSEVKDIDEQEIEELKAFIVQEFDIPQENLEEFIEDHIEALSCIGKVLVKHYLKKD